MNNEIIRLQKEIQDIEEAIDTLFIEKKKKEARLQEAYKELKGFYYVVYDYVGGVDYKYAELSYSDSLKKWYELDNCFEEYPKDRVFDELKQAVAYIEQYYKDKVNDVKNRRT